MVLVFVTVDVVLDTVGPGRFRLGKERHSGRVAYIRGRLGDAGLSDL